VKNSSDTLLKIIVVIEMPRMASWLGDHALAASLKFALCYIFPCSLIVRIPAGQVSVMPLNAPDPARLAAKLIVVGRKNLCTD
jgi:hypothetical protein